MKRTSVLWLGHTYTCQIPFSINDTIVASLDMQITRFAPGLLNDIFRITSTCTRVCNIKSPTEWVNFIDTCYSLGITGDEEKRNGGWRDADGEKELFRNWMNTEN